jgi:hypothetical protein
VSITFSDNSRKEVKIISLLGKEVYQKTTDQEKLEVNLSDVPAGLYFIRVDYPGSANTMTKKIIIQ